MNMFLTECFLKQALNHGKVIKAIKFNQKGCLKSYIDMNTEVQEKSKNDFEKDFLKLMNKSVFLKTVLESIEISKL